MHDFWAPLAKSRTQLLPILTPDTLDIAMRSWRVKLFLNQKQINKVTQKGAVVWWKLVYHFLQVQKLPTSAQRMERQTEIQRINPANPYLIIIKSTSLMPRVLTGLQPLLKELMNNSRAERPLKQVVTGQKRLLCNTTPTSQACFWAAGERRALGRTERLIPACCLLKEPLICHTYEAISGLENNCRAQIYEARWRVWPQGAQVNTFN